MRAEQVITTLLNDEWGEPQWLLREEHEERFQSDGIIEAMNHVAKNRTWQADRAVSVAPPIAFAGAGEWKRGRAAGSVWPGGNHGVVGSDSGVYVL